MIRGVHTMFYSSDPEGLRAFLRDKLGFSGHDVGEGWLIFDLPEADMGVHPSDDTGEHGAPPGTHSLSFYCDDLEATVAELRDLEAKVRRAMEFRGARYIHILVPCPLGWGHPSEDTIHIARLAKESGLFPVYESENGEITQVSKIKHKRPVEDYLKPQQRFAHLFKDPAGAVIIRRIQEIADRNIRRYGLLEGPESAS